MAQVAGPGRWTTCSLLTGTRTSSWETANVGLAGVSTICTVFEIARFLAEALTPWTVLFTHIIKLTCAVALLVLDSVAHAQRIDGHYTAVGLALDVALLLVVATFHERSMCAGGY